MNNGINEFILGDCECCGKRGVRIVQLGNLPVGRECAKRIKEAKKNAWISRLETTGFTDERKNLYKKEYTYMDKVGIKY